MRRTLHVFDVDPSRHLAMKVMVDLGGEETKGKTAEVDAKSPGCFLEEAQVTDFTLARYVRRSCCRE
jgi:hypothetical protein